MNIDIESIRAETYREIDFKLEISKPYRTPNSDDSIRAKCRKDFDVWMGFLAELKGPEA